VLEITGTASVADAIGVIQTFCLPLCQQGILQGISPMSCNQPQTLPAVRSHPLCQLVTGVVAGDLDRMRLFLMKGYRATVGSPYTAGTFTPDTLRTPAMVDLPVWVIEGGDGEVPAEGKPIAIFQHGLGGNKETGFYMANSLARANQAGGWATVMIDLPFHGARASDIARSTPQGEIPCVDGNGLPNIDPASVVCGPDGTCTGGCDGRRDASGTGFLSSNVFGTRDNFRQGTIDQLTLMHTLLRETQPGGALEDLDGGRMGYVGQSLGAITGGNLAGYLDADELEAAVLNVGGGSLTTILLNTVPAIAAPLYASLAAAGICEFNQPDNPASGCKPTAAFNQFVLTAQWALDPGDPLAVSVAAGERLGTDKLLMQISQPDPVVPNIASQLLGGAYGFLADGAPTDRYQVYDFSDATRYPQARNGSGCHGFLLAPICGNLQLGPAALVDGFCNTVGSQTQAASFLESGGTRVGPKRPASLGPNLNCP
jgi:pimeloyl-ACP methyl ester carboxylesterase